MFEFVRTLGKGSSGTAELVRRKGDGSLHCMKVIHVSIEEGGGSGSQSFDTEVSILSKLQHPHIVGYHGSFIHNNWLHIVMDYADGESP
jgi:serine/threonine protein kinase